MEYTIGSVADLITGKHTPNKPKISKKEVKMKKTEPQNMNAVAPKLTKKDGKRKKKHSALPDFESAMDKFETFNTGDSQNNKKNKKREFNQNKTKGEPSRVSSKRKSSNDTNDSTEVPKKKKKKQPSNETVNSKKHSAKHLNGIEDSDDETPDSPVKLSHNQKNAERRIKDKKKSEPNPEETAKTIYVGNVPLNTNKKQLKALFQKYGEIESLRFRGIPLADPRTPKRVAAIKKEFHPNRSSLYCYIRFFEEDSAKAAEEENGTLFENHHLRVETCDKKTKPDENKAIFIGNLSFDAEEEELWKLFEPCGAISSIRIIRDPRTGMGKGFAYVNFEDNDAVQLALEMENVKLKDRELRVSLSNLSGAKKKQKSVSKPLKRKQFRKKSQN
ncbi:unnamed protein product [Acanthoscelides obtectus]|uniref:RRM domain-containing protein n=1 Tax=Acanthoscelides obtectus TaxID=200917 RepID=A0A9P0NXW9_ACAOB|nr:unnamed protein product [Acanthoscelides obtectus]CAK1679041.1 RNA-binding protein 34 [Acanthoscelides obtectus]